MNAVRCHAKVDHDDDANLQCKSTLSPSLSFSLSFFLSPFLPTTLPHNGNLKTALNPLLTRLPGRSRPLHQHHALDRAMLRLPLLPPPHHDANPLSHDLPPRLQQPHLAHPRHPRHRAPLAELLAGPHGRVPARAAGGTLEAGRRRGRACKHVPWWDCGRGAR